MKKIIVLLTVCCFSFFYLSCKKEINVTDNSNSNDSLKTVNYTLTYKDDSISLINGNSIVFSSKIKVEGLPAKYFIEYGNSQLLFDRSTQEKSIQRDTNFVTVVDTIKNLMMNTNYYFRIRLSNSQDTIVGNVKTFSTQVPLFQKLYISNPTISGVTLNAILNLDHDDTYRFAYYSYGLIFPYQTPLQSVKAGIEKHISVNIEYLVPGDIYNFRVDLSNRIHSVYQAFTFTPDIINGKEFIYPLAIGNVWKYNYYYESHITGGPPRPRTWGVHTWRVNAKDTFADSTVFHLFCIKNDTHIGQANDTSYINDSTSFTIVVSQYVIQSNWTSEIGYNFSSDTRRLPRYTLSSVDTLERSGAKYVNNIGLISSRSYYPGSNWYGIETLDIISFSKN